MRVGANNYLEVMSRIKSNGQFLSLFHHSVNIQKIETKEISYISCKVSKSTAPIYIIHHN